MDLARIPFLVRASANEILRSLSKTWIGNIMPSAYTADQIATAKTLFLAAKGKGWDDVSAACLLGNTDGECSFLVHAWGDNHQATGIEQAHQPRRDMIKKYSGVDMETADAATQFEGMYWEMTTAPSPYRMVAQAILSAPTIEAKIAVFVVRQEQSGSQARDIARRTTLAEYWLAYAQNNGWIPAVLKGVTAESPIVLPKLQWIPSPNFSARTAHVDKIVIHDCEGYYEPSIGIFRGPNSGNAVSAHFVLRADGLEATQMVAIADKAWHCCAYNSESVGIEMEGFEKRGLPASEWGACEVMTAYLAKRLGIPIQWAKGGVGPGICRHYDLGAKGGGHMDPTLDEKVWLDFVAATKAIHDSPHLPTTWGVR